MGFWGVCVDFYGEMRSMSGRYTSYWNAFLLKMKIIELGIPIKYLPFHLTFDRSVTFLGMPVGLVTSCLKKNNFQGYCYFSTDLN